MEGKIIVVLLLSAVILFVSIYLIKKLVDGIKEGFYGFKHKIGHFILWLLITLLVVFMILLLMEVMGVLNIFEFI